MNGGRAAGGGLRLPLLLSLLAGAVVLALWPQDEVPGDEVAAAVARPPPPAPRMPPRPSPPAVQAATALPLRAELDESLGLGLFGPPPSPPPLSPPAPPPAPTEPPTPPPLQLPPLALLGVLHSAGEPPRALLEHGADVLVLRAGEALDAQWALEAIRRDALVFLHAGGTERRVLPVPPGDVPQ